LALLVGLSIEALAALVDFGQSEQIRLRAARAILDYAEYRPFHQATVITDSMIAKEIARLEAELSRYYE
jgi:hypothetical protein